MRCLPDTVITESQCTMVPALILRVLLLTHCVLLKACPRVLDEKHSARLQGGTNEFVGTLRRSLIQTFLGSEPNDDPSKLLARR